MDRIGPKWTGISPIGSKWIELDRNGSNQTEMDRIRPKWTEMGLLHRIINKQIHEQCLNIRNFFSSLMFEYRTWGYFNLQVPKCNHIAYSLGETLFQTKINILLSYNYCGPIRSTFGPFRSAFGQFSQSEQDPKTVNNIMRKIFNRRNIIKLHPILILKRGHEGCTKIKGSQSKRGQN